ncbi:MAG: spore cortex biosynthesis protein YabQ [Oscillospiraceae bacterium]|nr:spore cortex biosynthesis protein YabQ [Oscillospiraceae bacterium]
MEQPLGTQALQFLLSLGLGLGFGLLYDLFRGLRRNCRWLTHLLDLCFALLWLCGSLLLALYAGGGAYRIFMLLGTVLGFALWLRLCSPFVAPAMGWFWRVLTTPLRLLGRLFGKILKKTRKFLKNIFSTGKKSVTIKKAPSHRKGNQKVEERPDAAAQIVTHYKAHPSGRDGVCHRDCRYASDQDQPVAGDP